MQIEVKLKLRFWFWKEEIYRGQTPQNLKFKIFFQKNSKTSTPQARPLNFPLRCGPGDLQGMLETCKACWDTICNACWDTPLPWTEFLTHASENITLPQTSFAAGNKCCITLQIQIFPLMVICFTIVQLSNKNCAKNKTFSPRKYAYFKVETTLLHLSA